MSDAPRDPGLTFDQARIINEHLRRRFVPFAWTCYCNGKHRECARSLASPHDRAQVETVRVICAWMLDIAR